MREPISQSEVVDERDAAYWEGYRKGLSEALDKSESENPPFGVPAPAQPTPQPVAWRFRTYASDPWIYQTEEPVRAGPKVRHAYVPHVAQIEPLYAAQPPAAPVETKWECMGRKQALPEPGECNWPDCGCDPHATKVIESLIEQGWQPPEAPRSSAETEEAPTGPASSAALAPAQPPRE